MPRLFFSYSHKDEALRNELEIHLAPLKREGIISSWHDRRISAGDDFDASISSELETADIVLLLVSAYFLASDYCIEKELAYALEKHRASTAVVIPVILHPCDWHSAPFGHLRATPTDGKPVSLYANQHEAFTIIAKDIREAALRLGATRGAAPSPVLKHPRVAAGPEPGPRSSNLRVKRHFDDHEQDAFLEESFEYITRYFEGSLDQLAKRNPQLKARLKRIDATSFSASIYDNGKRVSECSVWYGGSGFRSRDIAFSHTADLRRNSWNESLSVGDDGYTLHLKPLGMAMMGSRSESVLSQEGAAEYFWSLLIRPLQE